MGASISGDNGNFPGQIVVLGDPTSAAHTVTRSVAGSLKTWVGSLDLNGSAPLDLTTLPVLSAKYIPVRAYIIDPTANLSSATLGLYTASGGGGTAVVAPETLSGLTGANTIHLLTIASVTAPVTATLLYPRLTVAAGTAGTALLILEYLDLEHVS